MEKAFLTDTQIRQLKFSGDTKKDFERHLVGGVPRLYFYITRKGKRDFKLIDANSTSHHIADGNTPVKEARQLAVDFIEKQKQERDATAENFETFAGNWLKIKKSSIAAGNYSRTLARLDRYIYPHFKGRKIGEIQYADFIKLLTNCNHLVAKNTSNSLETPKRVLMILKQIFRYARQLGAIQSDPCPENVDFLGIDNGGRHLRAVLDKRTLTEFLKDIRKTTAFPPVKYLLYLQLLMAQRPSNIRGLKWSQIDEENGVKFVTYEAEEMKMKRVHKVALSDITLRILESQRHYSKGDYVFDGYNGRSELSASAAIPFLKKIGWYTKFTPHGSRAMFRTFVSEYRHEHGISMDVAEKCLAHTSQGVQAAYDRDFALIQQKALFDWYANFLNNLCEFDIYDF